MNKSPTSGALKREDLKLVIHIITFKYPIFITTIRQQLETNWRAGKQLIVAILSYALFV